MGYINTHLRYLGVGILGLGLLGGGEDRCWIMRIYRNGKNMEDWEDQDVELLYLHVDMCVFVSSC